jgi:hypothetical protein
MGARDLRIYVRAVSAKSAGARLPALLTARAYPTKTAPARRPGGKSRFRREAKVGKTSVAFQARQFQQPEAGPCRTLSVAERTEVEQRLRAEGCCAMRLRTSCR